MRALHRPVVTVLCALATSLALVAGCSNGETKFTGLEPNTGTFTGGEEIELQGQGFPRGGVAVTFATHKALAVVVESDHKIKVTTPAGDKSSTVDVTITFDDGRAFQLKNGFRYIDTTQQRNTMDKFFNKAGGEQK